MAEQTLQLHGEPETKDGYPLWSASPSVAKARTLILMERMHETGVTVDQWANSIGRAPDRARRWFNNGDATNYLTDDMVTVTCELLHVGIDYLSTHYVTQPMLKGISNPTDATPNRYTPEKLLEAYAMLDQGEQEKVTSYIADLLLIHHLLHETERIRDGYEKRLDFIFDTLAQPIMSAAATTDDFRVAAIMALQPPYLSDQESLRLNKPTFNGSPIFPPLDSEEFEKRYEEALRAVVPRGRPRKGSDAQSDA